MIRFLPLILLAAITTPVFSQQVVWGYSFGTPNQFTITASASDAAGNIYTAYQSRKIILQASNYGDIYISKHDDEGNLIWTKDFEGTAKIQSIKTDSNGDLIAGGQFASNLYIENDTLISDALRTSSVYFKLNGTGNVLWHKMQKNTPNYDFSVQKIFLDAADNIYSVGLMGHPKCHITKMDTAGNIVKQRLLPIRTIADIEVDSDGYVYITGGCNEFTVFDTVTVTYPDSLFYPIYVAKYDTSFTAMWVRFHTYNTFDYTPSVNIVDNNLYWFNDRKYVNTTITTKWLTKFDKAGNFIKETKELPQYFHFKHNSKTVYLKDEGKFLLAAGKWDSLKIHIVDTALVLKENHLWVGKGIDAQAVSAHPHQVIISGTFTDSVITVEGKKLYNANPWLQNDLFMYAMLRTPPAVGMAAMDQELRIYPNPTTDYIKVEGADVQLLKLYNLSGRLVKVQKQNTIDISDLPAGVYILEAIVNNSIVRQKVIKQ